MKIQLFLPQFQSSIQQYEDCTLIPVNNIQGITNASCTLVHLGNCCDFIGNRVTFIEEAVKKLRYNGRLTIEGTDLIDIMYDLLRGVVSIDDIQSMLFAGRQSCSTLEQTETLLQQMGLRIVQKRLTQYRYSIIAERPGE